MKTTLSIALVVMLSGCAAGFDIRCPNGDPTHCSDAERASAAAIGLSVLAASQRSNVQVAQPTYVPTPSSSANAYKPYVPGPVQTSTGTVRCQLVATGVEGVSKTVCWKE